MNDSSSFESVIQRGLKRRQGHQGVGQRIHWSILRKSTLPEIHLGPEYYAHCDLKRSGKLSNAALLLMDIKDSGIQICAIHTMQRF